VIDSVSETEARMLGMSDDEAAAAATVAERVLAEDLLARARAADAAGRCRRETPVTCTLPDGTLVEGVVDLAFEDAGRWVVVDYKTDRELAAHGEDRYRLQVAIYASAIAQATGAPCDGVLLVV
jgi:ATP-dependent exoDNAse (exonuclease V) beta subunit